LVPLTSPAVSLAVKVAGTPALAVAALCSNVTCLFPIDAVTLAPEGATQESVIVSPLKVAQS
jgi:hypothetical protein